MLYKTIAHRDTQLAGQNPIVQAKNSWAFAPEDQMRMKLIMAVYFSSIPSAVTGI